MLLATLGFKRFCDCVFLGATCFGECDYQRIDPSHFAMAPDRGSPRRRNRSSRYPPTNAGSGRGKNWLGVKFASASKRPAQKTGVAFEAAHSQPIFATLHTSKKPRGGSGFVVHPLQTATRVSVYAPEKHTFPQRLASTPNTRSWSVQLEKQRPMRN